MIILLAAHFSRGGNDILAGITLVVPFLFLVKQKWVIIGLELLAYLAAVVWLYGAYAYIQIRIATGDDWMRLLIIMGAVALYTAGVGFFLRSQKIKEVYGINE
jgi:predicted membrane protein